MKYNNYNEFKDDLIQYRTRIIIPDLNIEVDKTQFIINGKYDTLAEDDYLRELYRKHR